MRQKAKKIDQQSKKHASQLTDKESKQERHKVKSSLRTRIISFRVSNEEHRYIQSRCTNSHGERLIAPGDFARYTALNHSPSKHHEDPIERYRLAIAAQLAAAVSDAVLVLDADRVASYESQIRQLTDLTEEMAGVQAQIQQFLTKY